MDDQQPLLSPWAHPKANGWFEMVFERSGLIQEIDDQVNQPDERMDVASARLLLSLLAMLGRPGVWPAQHRRVLAKAASKANRILNADAEAEQVIQKKPMTLAEHQRAGKTQSAMEIELEIVRRWAGMSNRTTEIGQPTTWGDFWG